MGLASHGAYGDGYTLAVYICVAALVLMFGTFMFYILCSKRYKLNWYEQVQLSNVVQPASTFDLSDDTNEEKFTDSHSISRSPQTPLIQDTQVFMTYPENVGIAKYVQPDGNKGDVETESQNGGNCSNRGARPRLTSMHSKLDHTKIDAAMYNAEDHVPYSNEEAKGFLNFSIHYDSCLELITVHLKQACDLEPRQFSGTADPYAKVRILPDKKASRKSCVHKNTTNPQFNEDFIFDVVPQELPIRVLQIIIYDFDEYSRHECMGSVELPLEHIDLSEKVTLWKELSLLQESVAEIDRGELMISLCYLPSAQRLTVVIMKARNIFADYQEDSDAKAKISDCFVKVVLHQTGKKQKKKRKTSVQRGTANPVFNEAINFDINKEILDSMVLDLTVVNVNLLGQNEIVGRVIIGPNSVSEPAAQHYQELVASKGNAIAMWHPLMLFS